MQDGDLDGYLRRRAGQLLDEDEVMSKFVQAALAVQYVHSKVPRMLRGSTLTMHALACLGTQGLYLPPFKSVGGPPGCHPGIVPF